MAEKGKEMGELKQGRRLAKGVSDSPNIVLVQKTETSRSVITLRTRFIDAHNDLFCIQ